MSKITTIDFLAPSLHPNSIIDVSIPQPGPSHSLEPIVRHVPIKYGKHQPVGSIKRMIKRESGEMVVLDDSFRMSVLRRGAEGDAMAPEITAQLQAAALPGSVWSGLVETQGGVIGSLSSGFLHLLPSSESAHEEVQTANVASSILCSASSSSTATNFAIAGKEVDVSIRDVERSFASNLHLNGENGDGRPGKRKKVELEAGETWRAKNLAHDHLNLRPPIHHLTLTYAPNSTASLFSGTKSGTIRRYDTRQKKPVSDWKLAREGGIGCLAFQSENELIYADRASLLAVADIRTGKMAYSIPSTCTVHHLSTFPSIKEEQGGREIGLASVSSDASLRLYGTTRIPEEGVKGNWGGEGKKGAIAGMVGGVGVGSIVWMGHGEVEAPIKPSVEEADEGDEAGEGEVWDDMEAIGDDEGHSDEEDSD